MSTINFHAIYVLLFPIAICNSGGKVLIVIGGDDQYRDENEEERAVISRWARRKVASQFNEEYLDGRESFIISFLGTNNTERSTKKHCYIILIQARKGTGLNMIRDQSQ